MSMCIYSIYTFDEEGVVAALAEFHHDIEEGGNGSGRG